MKVSIGNIATPIISIFIPAITTGINHATYFFNTIGKLLGTFGIKMPQAINTGAKPSIAGLNDSISSATEGMKGAGSQAGKTAKEIKRAFSNLDELNIITFPDKEKAGGSGIGGGGSVNTGIGDGPIGTPSFDTTELDANVEKMHRFINEIIEPWKNINLEPAKNAFIGLFESINPLGTVIGENLKFGYFEVLVPLSKWTIEEAVPKTIDFFAGGVRVFTSSLKAFQPMGKWFWDSFLVPIGKFTGAVFIGTLSNITKGLNATSDWINKNQGVFRGMTTVVLGFAGAWKTMRALSYIQRNGGNIKVIKETIKWLDKLTLAKIRDKVATEKIHLLYAKDYLKNSISNIKSLIKTKEALTLAKIRDKVVTEKIHLLYAKNYLKNSISNIKSLIKMKKALTLVKIKEIGLKGKDLAITTLLVAKKGAHALATGAVTAATTAYTIATGGATAAVGLLSVALNLLPLVAIITLIGLLVGGLALWYKQSKENEEQEKREAEALKKRGEALQENIDKLKDQNQAYIDLKNQRKDKVDGDLAELSLTQNLATELNNLVDANGNVLKGNEKRTQFILKELNKAMGTEYQLVNGQIQKYDEMKNKVEEYMQTQRTQIYLESEKASVLEALKNLSKEKAEIDEAERIRDEAKSIRDKVNNEENNKRLKEAETQLESTKNKYRDYHDSIARYDTMSMAAFEKNHEKVKELYAQKISGIKSFEEISKLSSEEQKRIAKNQFETQLSVYETYANNLKNKIPGYNQEQLDEMKKQVDEAKNVYEKVGKATIDGFENSILSDKWKAIQAMSGITEDIKREGENKLEIRGEKSKAFDRIGTFTVDGYIDGMNNKKSSLFRKVTGIFKDVILVAKKALDSNSPSKKFIALGEDTNEGYKMGILQNADKLKNTVFSTFKNVIPKKAELLPNFKFTNNLNGVNALSKSFMNLNGTITETIQLLTVFENLKNPQLKTVGSGTSGDNLEQSINDLMQQLINIKNEKQKQEFEITIKHEYEDGRVLIEKINTTQENAGKILLKV